MKGNQEHHLLEAVLEASEVAVDAITSNEVLAEIPIIGIGFKIAKATDTVRDRAFMAKLAKFVSALGTMDEVQIKKYKDKLHSDPKESERVGEALFLILERVTSLEKPVLLADAFIAYLDNVITSEELRRVAQAIDMAFADDLEKLLNCPDPQGAYSNASGDSWAENLSSSGLTRRKTIQAGAPLLADLFDTYEVSPLGHNLIKSHLHGRGASR